MRLLLFYLSFLLPLWAAAQVEPKGAVPANPTPENQDLWLYKGKPMRALIIGVSDYAESSGISDLHFADDDARALRNWLVRDPLIQMDSNKIAFLTDSTATEGTITTELLKLKKLAKDNTVLIYFSGHGINEFLGKETPGYLMLHDSEISGPDITAFPMETLLSYIKDISQKNKVILILDACHSGAIESKPIMAQLNDFKKNFIGLLSSKESQESYELDDLGHGLFSYLLLRGLDGDAGTGAVLSLDNVFMYVDTTMQSLKENHHFKFSQRPKKIDNDQEVSLCETDKHHKTAQLPQMTMQQLAKAKGIPREVKFPEKAIAEYLLRNIIRDHQMLFDGDTANDAEGRIRLRYDLMAAWAEDGRKLLLEYARKGESKQKIKAYKAAAKNLEKAKLLAGKELVPAFRQQRDALLLRTLGNKPNESNAKAIQNSIELLNKAIALDSTSSHLYYELAKRKEKAGALSGEVASFFQKAIDLNPYWAKPFGEQGKLFKLEKDSAEAALNQQLAMAVGKIKWKDIGNKNKELKVMLDSLSPKDLPVIGDADRDGIPDLLDACKDKAGPKYNRGCPDNRVEKSVETVTETINGVTFVMKKVKGGSFQMGSNDGEEEEKPVHQVTVPDFALGETEVTQLQWRAVMGDNPSYFLCDDCPVERVIWKDAQQFIEKLNKLSKSGNQYRLPTEAEWEYAARGGAFSKNYVYAGSDTLSLIAWWSGGDGRGGRPESVRQKRPNELGLFDMTGNVYELCQDAWVDNYQNAPTDGSARKGKGNWRPVIRGGAYNTSPKGQRIANRIAIDKEKDYKEGAEYVGLRLVLEIKKK